MDEKDPAVTEPPVTSPVNPHASVTDPASANETGTETWFDKLGGQLVPYPQVRQRWAAHTSSFDAMIDELGEDGFAECYPWLTHANVHTGSVYVPGDLHLDDLDQVFVIDGDLTIGGVLRVFASFEYPALVITGDLHARHLLTEFHARLLVLGSLHLDGVFVCDSSDAAEVEILGATTANACITDTSIDFGQPPTLTHTDAELLDELRDIDALYKALRDGLQVAAHRVRPRCVLTTNPHTTHHAAGAAARSAFHA